MNKLLTFLLVAIAANASAARYSFVHFSDIHANSSAAGTQITNWNNAVSFILANTNDGDWNFVGATCTGDMFESTITNDVGSLTLTGLTNGINQLITNGIFFFPVNGNHDCDDTYGAGVAGGWSSSPALVERLWTNIFPASWFYWQTNYVTGYQYRTSMIPGLTRTASVTFQRGDLKLVMVSYDSAFTNAGSIDTLRAQFLPQTQFVTNQLALYPDHLGIVLTHFMLGMPWGTTVPTRIFPRISPNDETNVAGYTNLGPATVCWEQGLGYSSNLMFVLSGHTRSLLKGRVARPKEVGGFADIQCFNLQGIGGVAPGNGKFINVLTFDTTRKTCEVRTLHPLTGATLPNWSTEVRRIAGPQTNAFEHNWHVPFSVPKQKRIFRL